MIELPRAAYTYEPKGESYSYPSSKDFSEIFQEFCLETIMSRKCTIAALQEVKMLCNNVEQREIFNTQFGKELKYDDFKQQLESSSSTLLYSLKDQWLNSISEKIIMSFRGEHEGWFDLSKVNQNNYETGKLKSFLTLVKLEMQTALKNLIFREFNKYVKTISSYVPDSVEIISQTEVVNTYSDG